MEKIYFENFQNRKFSTKKSEMFQNQKFPKLKIFKIENFQNLKFSKLEILDFFGKLKKIQKHFFITK